MRVYGNVEWILQALPGQTESKGTLAFLTDYDYDVMSGRVREVRLQPGRLDQMRQRYRYDHDGRILSVATSRDGHIWDRDAGYGYYAHGPLKRMELGRDSVQGMDRAYTINGWTKSLNVPSLLAADDPGGDGKSGANHEHVGRDAFGMVLGYYGKDFVHAGSVIDSAGAGSWQQLPQSSLYNGNIASWSWNTRKTDGTLLGALASTYRYDLLNRLRADTVRTRGVSSWDSPASKFRSAYTYDGNGNILTLDRRDDAGSHLDQLRYRYTPGMNRMTHVDELGGSTVTAGDIEDQDTLNYAYDATGNMTQDVSEGINASGIVWTPSNKIRTITKAGSSPTSKLEYLYDAMGNRVVKRYYEPSNSLVKTTWYVRDAKGNVLGIYEKLASSGDVVAKENPIYGSSRVGEWRTGALYSSVATDTLVTNDVIYSRLLGNRRYELTDHLGNVRVAVSDVLLDHSGSPDAEVVSYTDYHPYGMAMTNRTWQAGDYRFGYNGQEKTDEVAGAGNHLTAEFWEYDTRLGRRWNLDPRPVTGVSDYATFLDSPIQLHDPRGDSSFHVGQESANMFMDGVNRLLQPGQPNPFIVQESAVQTSRLGQGLSVVPYFGTPQTIYSIGTNPAAASVTYSAEQNTAFDNLRGVVTNPNEHSLMFAVDRNDRFSDVFPLPNLSQAQQNSWDESLARLDFSGVTFERAITLQGGAQTSMVFVARNPVTLQGRTILNADPHEPGMHTLHEIGGHVFGTMSGIVNTNTFAEQYETAFRRIFIKDFNFPLQYLRGTAPTHR